jgi:UDP-glucose 4-epimerase
MSELIIQDHAKASTLRYVILRYFNVGGADPLGRIGQNSRANHKNNTVSGKLSALALRGKRARQFIAFNLFSWVILTNYVI